MVGFVAGIPEKARCAWELTTGRLFFGRRLRDTKSIRSQLKWQPSDMDTPFVDSKHWTQNFQTVLATNYMLKCNFGTPQHWLNFVSTQFINHETCAAIGMTNVQWHTINIGQVHTGSGVKNDWWLLPSRKWITWKCNDRSVVLTANPTCKTAPTERVRLKWSEWGLPERKKSSPYGGVYDL
jgi:hypothetical protein